jgi:hypothetical protein
VAKFELDISGFKGTYGKLNRSSNNEDIFEPDLIRCVFTVGARSRKELSKNPAEQNFSILCDAFSCVFRVDWTSSANLTLQNYYKMLDQSVQACSTYWIAMAMTKLVAERVLRIRCLAHVSRMIKAGAVVPSGNTKKRPDLIGYGLNREWHVLESKGVTTNKKSGPLNKAKSQLKGVYRVKGRAPATRSSCLTRLLKDKTEVYVNDPEDMQDEPVSLQVDESLFLRTYYSALRELVKSGEQRVFLRNDRPFRVVPVVMGGKVIYIGLQDEIYEVPDLAIERLDWLTELPISTRSNETQSIGMDGIIVTSSINSDGQRNEW